jgi:hypothetical protein
VRRRNSSTSNSIIMTTSSRVEGGSSANSSVANVVEKTILSLLFPPLRLFHLPTSYLAWCTSSSPPSFASSLSLLVHPRPLLPPYLPLHFCMLFSSPPVSPSLSLTFYDTPILPFWFCRCLHIGSFSHRNGLTHFQFLLLRKGAFGRKNAGELPRLPPLLSERQTPKKRTNELILTIPTLPY